MKRLIFEDLEWKPVILDPDRYTLKDGIKVKLEKNNVSGDCVVLDSGSGTVTVGMPEGRGKISDAGYDQMACLVTSVPVCEKAVFHARVRLMTYPQKDHQNGQEGTGLFLRDTMDMDPFTGYPYSNEAIAGFLKDQPGLYLRDGIDVCDAENARNSFECGDRSLADAQGIDYEITLEKNGGEITASISDGEELLKFEIESCRNIFSVRDQERMYLGFMAARGCSIEAALERIYVDLEEEDCSLDNYLYVSSQGSPSGAGTEKSPLDIQTAIERCRAGQTIRVEPGLYRLRRDLIISADNSGSSNSRKRITSVCDERNGTVIIDFCGSRYSFRIDGNYWDICGLTVTGGYGFCIQGSYNHLHCCCAVRNLETGFLIRHRAADACKRKWPKFNIISNCISYLNADISQQHADGFACKVASGEGNRFIRCVSLLNSDDGFDLFSKNKTIGAVKLEDCFSWFNGFNVIGEDVAKTRGNGNGFKLGGSGLSIDHELVRCEAIGNRGYGFTSNSNPHMRLDRCRAGNNSRNYMFYFTGEEAQADLHMEQCTDNDETIDRPLSWMEERVAALNDIPKIRLQDERPDLRYSSIERVLGFLEENGMESGTGCDIERYIENAFSLAGNISPNRPRVLIMCSSLYGGGAERVACRLACGLNDDYQVIMLYINDKGQTYHLDPGIETMQLPRFTGSFETVMNGRSAFVKWLKSFLNVKVSISFMFTMNKINVCSKGKDAVICSERNNPAKRDPEHMNEIGRIYEAADHVVFQSETVRSLFSDDVHKHSSIILNPVTINYCRTESKHRIVNIGRLVPQKNQQMLIKAFADFYKTHSGYTLSLYGEGELEAELKALVHSYGLDGSIMFCGYVNDVERAVADAEIFVLSSDYEGLSNALLECMMMGLPCISTKCEGSRDLIRSGENGLLVDVGNCGQLSEAMTRLADDEVYREKLASQGKRTSDKFRSDYVIEKWKHLIEQLGPH